MLSNLAPVPASAASNPPPVSERGDGAVPGLVARHTATGTKTDTPRIETPQSVSVIGREQIELTGSQSLGEVVRHTPGVRELFSGADSRYDQFQIRGFNASTTGVYLDGLQILASSALTFRLEPFGMERIEVLRGPSSVLYGGGNPGGLINAISKRPTDTAFGYLSTGVNGFGNAYGSFDLGGPAARDPNGGQWSYRLTGTGRLGGNQYRFGEDDRGFIAPAVTWRPDADTTLTILTSYRYDHTTGVPFLPYQGTVVAAPWGRIPTSFVTSARKEAGPYNGFERNQYMAGYQFEHRFDDVLTFRQGLRYAYGETDIFGIVGTGGYVGNPALANLRRTSLYVSPKIDLFNVDNQVEAKLSTGPLQHRILAGLDYRQVLFDGYRSVGPASPINVFAPIYNLRLTSPQSPTIAGYNAQRQLGAYLQDQIKLDRFTLVLSGRHDWVNTNGKNALAPQSLDSFDSAFSGRAGLVYTSAWGFAPYVSYSKSFLPLIGLNSTGQPLVPERGEQYEAGIKYQPEGVKSYLSVAAFDLKRQNFVAPSLANPLLVQQNGEARSKGIEAEVVLQVVDGLRLIGSYTAFDIENTKNRDPGVIGLKPSNTPDRLASFFVDYTVQSGWLRGFGAGAGLRHVGSSYADVTNTLRIPDSTVVDAVLHFEYRNWRAQVNGFNLFDKRYVAQCASATECYYAERRKVLASLTYRW